MTAKKKKIEQLELPVNEFLKEHTLEEAVAAVDEAVAEEYEADDIPVIPLHVVKSKAKPGDPDYDWQAEYPGEEVYVYTVPEGTKSPAGLTIGLAKLNPTTRKPKPGKLRTYHREGGMSVMWYFIELVSSATSLKVQEELEDNEYTAMLREWADFAGIELSE